MTRRDKAERVEERRDKIIIYMAEVNPDKTRIVLAKEESKLRLKAAK